MSDTRCTELRQFVDQWTNCQRCSLSKWRDASDKRHEVFGSGSLNQLMIVGEGPGVEEEATGKPSVGQAGKLLRRQLSNFQLLDKAYFTYTVLCRSCENRLDSDGLPVTYKGAPKVDDREPLEPQVQACRPRLLEEIYLVDPLLIIAAGGFAAKVLLGRNVAISQESGDVREMTVPGRSYEAVLTDKKKAWRRRVKGQWVTPTVPFSVKYPVLLMVHPGLALRHENNTQFSSPMHKFTVAVDRARSILEMREKVYGGKIWEDREELDEFRGDY